MSQILDYMRLEDDSGKPVEVLLVKRDDGYHVATVEKHIGFRLRLLASSPEPGRAEDAFDLAVENFQRATDNQYSFTPLHIVSDRIDEQAAKALKLLEHPDWGLPDWKGAEAGEDQVEADFDTKLRRQIKEWKGSGDTLLVQNHRYWPEFRRMMADAVEARHGDRVELYRAFYGDAARDVAESGMLPTRRFSSWTSDLAEAKTFLAHMLAILDDERRDAWVIVSHSFDPDEVVFGPVALPNYTRIDAMRPFHWETEYVVESSEPALPVDVVAEEESK